MASVVRISDYVGTLVVMVKTYTETHTRSVFESCRDLEQDRGKLTANKYSDNYGSVVGVIG